MRVTLTEEERAELQAAQRTSWGVRQWRRYQAALSGGAIKRRYQAALSSGALACGWRTAGHRRSDLGLHPGQCVQLGAGLARARGIAEGDHPGAERRLPAAAERALAAL